MISITFDTHQLIRNLREADFTEKQAEEVVRVVSQSQEHLVSTEHFDLKLESLESRVNGELKLNRWMLGVSVAGTLSTLFLVVRLMMTMPTP